MSEVKFCGKCIRKETLGNYCPTGRGIIHSLDEACPAFDDGAFDRAVVNLIRAMREYHPAGTTLPANCYDKEIAAVEEAMKGRGR